MSRPERAMRVAIREQRAVASQHDNHIDVIREQVARRRARAQRGRPRQRRGIALVHRLDAAGALPGAEPCHVLGCGDEAVFGDDANTSNGHGRKCRRNSTLPFCPVIGEGVAAHGVSIARCSSCTRGVPGDQVAQNAER
jgi:hypothetical protein